MRSRTKWVRSLKTMMIKDSPAMKRSPKFGLCSLVFATFACAASVQAQTRPVLGPLTPQVAQNTPQIRVTLTHPVYLIHHDPKTGAPFMPKDVIATAQCLHFPLGTILPNVFTWHTTLEWSIKGYGTKHMIGSRYLPHSSPYSIPLDEQIRGGTLTVVAKASVGGKEYIGVAQAKVLADNPPRSAIFARLPHNRWGLLASKIGMAESGLKQFAVAKREIGGFPEVSSTRDIGVMQLNAPSGAITSEDQVWDWRENVKQGLLMLEGKRRTSQLAYRAGNPRTGFRTATPIGGSALANVNVARALLGLGNAEVPAVNNPAPLLTAPGSGLCPGDPDPDKLQLTQIERDAIRRYNGGREYSLTPRD